MTGYHKLTLSENFTPHEGLIPEFPLIPERGSPRPLGLRTGIVSLMPVGNLGGLQPMRLAVRLIPPGHAYSSILYSTAMGDAVALAVNILTLFAPQKLVNRPPEVVKQSPVNQIAPGPFRIKAMTPDCLPGTYVNIHLNGGAPTVCFGDGGYALKEANRIAEKAPAPATVITARIEHVHKSEVKITSYGVK
jgi:hypothetical protein